MALEALDCQNPKVLLQNCRQSEFVDRMADCLSLFAAAVAPLPIFYRSLDLRESGAIGSFSYTFEPELFDWELCVLQKVCDWRGYKYQFNFAFRALCWRICLLPGAIRKKLAKPTQRIWNVDYGGSSLGIIFIARLCKSRSSRNFHRQQRFNSISIRHSPQLGTVSRWF